MIGASQNFGKVAVLMGGQSAEREISFMSGQGVLDALKSQGVDAHAFDPAKRNLSDLQQKGSSAALLHFTADLAKMAPCKARLNCWVSPTQDRV